MNFGRIARSSLRPIFTTSRNMPKKPASKQSTSAKKMNEIGDSPSPPPMTNRDRIPPATAAENGRPDNPENAEPNPNCTVIDGIYTYRDQGSGNEFQWNEGMQQWKPYKVAGNLVTYDGSTYNYTDVQDGTIFEYDPSKSAWFPKLDEEFLIRYQLSYGVNPSDVPSSSIPPKHPEPVLAPSKPIPAPADKNDKSLKRKAPTPAEWFDLDDAQNTKVYVSNLPLDITEEEFMEFMSKCGLVMKDPSTGEAKMKLYTDTEGNKKGDGLCTYIKIESVHLALQILDGADIRGHKVSVERAQFQLKGAYDPTKKPKSKKRKDKEKLKKQQEKLFEWKPEKMRGERSKHERIVVVQNAFSPADFDADVGLILEYQQDFREEAGKCGTCKKVVVFDRHPDGILQIYMSTPEEADGVVTLFNNRFFGGKQIVAFLWDGHTKYKIEETDAERDDRLKNWEKFIGEDPAAGKNVPEEEKATPPPSPQNPAEDDD